ncbi:hypothetical protein Nepgr_032975 [Nepenthes gracilis]|uniref:Uncharacterized protein n=1 Tax=Nepenthes gracilis TaxID=150966 RepID=A0AAD3TKJ3_NEPGR|nr:hypothetical protein Nepgr_032975 [Nepenthes gracilis]
MSGGGFDISSAKDDDKVSSIFWVGYPGEAGEAAISPQRFDEENPISILDEILMIIQDDIDCYPHLSKGATTWVPEANKNFPLPASLIVSNYVGEELTEIAGKVNEDSDVGKGVLWQQDEQEGEYDDEFSFICGQTKSPISAEEIFENGQIRPMFECFSKDNNSQHINHDLLRSLSMPINKVFVERRDLQSAPRSEADFLGQFTEETRCELSPVICKKSNSTGVSKLFSFRDMLSRSNSDSKGALVFLTSSKAVTTSFMKKRSTSGSSDGRKLKSEAPQVETTSEKSTTSSYAFQYGKKKGGKDGEKRKSYLPYRQDLIGFFTNVNGLRRNVHP